MKIKILQTLAILLLTSNFLYSQEKIIELIVSDTIELEAEEIVYLITIHPKLSLMFTKRTSSKTWLNKKHLEAIILDNKDIEDNDEFKISPESATLPFTKAVNINGKEALFKFHKMLRQYENVSGNIHHLGNSKLDEYHSKLISKLALKAKKEALHLAKLMETGNVEIIDILELQPISVLHQSTPINLQSTNLQGLTTQTTTSPVIYKESVDIESDAIRFESTKIILKKELKFKFRIK